MFPSVATFRYYLRSFVEEVFFWVIGYLVLLVQTQGTMLCFRCVRFRFSNYSPTHVGVSVQFFHFPQLYGKGCAVLVALMIERGFVIGEAFFECTFTQSDVLLFLVIWQVRSYCRLVDDIRGQAVVVHGAIVLIHTIASSLNVGWLGC